MGKTILKDEYFWSIIEDTSIPANEVAVILNIGPATVTRLSKQRGVRRPAGRKKVADCWISVKCSVCGSMFEALMSKSRKYCKRECYEISKKGKTVISAERISELLKKRWQNPTDAMLKGIEKRRKDDINEYTRYRNKLANLSEKTYEKHKSEINPNNLPRGLAGVDGAYHLDHIVPSRFGYDNNIPVEVLAKKDNLQMLPWRDNITKGDKIYEKMGRTC